MPPERVRSPAPELPGAGEPACSEGRRRAARCGLAMHSRLTDRGGRGDTDLTQPPKPIDYGFVSCDIVGHSGESDVGVQTARIARINGIIAEFVEPSDRNSGIWASGGDGGHVALAGDGSESRAVR